MIIMSAEQTAAVQVELDRVRMLVNGLGAGDHTDAMVAKLRTASMACINAVSVIRDIEADIRVRGVAQRETA